MKYGENYRIPGASLEFPCHNPPRHFLCAKRGSFMRRIVFLCVAGLLVAGAALGEDFWVKKDYMQWTDEEVKTLLTNSPWAKDVSLTIPPSALGRGGGQGRGIVSETSFAQGELV